MNVETFKYSYIIGYNMNDANEMKKILRFPRLDTVIMVERFIKENDGEFKKRALWESLPKKMMYQTFCVILDYLFYSNKISIDAEGKVGWIYYPQEARNYLERVDLARRTWKKDQ